MGGGISSRSTGPLFGYSFKWVDVCAVDCLAVSVLGRVGGGREEYASAF